MPKTNQIRYLAPSRQTLGATYHWKPSPKLRKLGWKNLCLGTEWPRAVQGAIERNEEVRLWLLDNEKTEPGRRAPARVLRWSDLLDTYKSDPKFLELRASSRKEYDLNLRALTTWALDGQLRLEDLDRNMIVQLRDALVKDPRKHRTASLLRCLRVVVNFGVGRGCFPRGLADDLDIPTAPSRKVIIAPADVERLAARADAEGQSAIALAIRLGFWTLQREGDLLSLTRFHWRVMQNMEVGVRKVLAGADGKVMGLRLQQSKTEAWVHIPPPPPLRAMVEAQFAALAAANGPHSASATSAPHLIAHDASGAPWDQKKFQRVFRSICNLEGLDVQFRDLRRSGMISYAKLSVPLPMITAISGHAVLGNRKTILDTYMPSEDGRLAAEGVALAWPRWCERVEQEKVDAEIPHRV